MKRCPECRRDYYDEMLLYCLDDGNLLLGGPGLNAEPATALFGGPQGSAKYLQPSLDPRAALPIYSNSIAVLPFINLSSDVENDYFCDGLAEELLNALAKIHQLKVAARTSAFSFRGKDVNVGEIGEKLGVQTVLEGSVRKSGKRLRIAVQLVSAEGGYQLWSERYDREIEDIFDVQDEITIAVVASLRVKLLGDQRAMVLKRHTDNPEAFENYLKGIYYRWKLEPTEFRKCGAYFHDAVKIDPKFALAHFGLASYYGYGTAWGLLDIDPEDGWDKAEAAMKKVRELDPMLPEVLIENAMKLVHYRLWDEAGTAIEAAAAVNPTFGEIHHLNAFYLLMTGRFGEAINEAKLALTIDPISVSYRHFLGVCLHFAGELDLAIEQYRSALDLGPVNALLHEMLSGALMQKGMLQDAAAEMRASFMATNDLELVAIMDRGISGADVRSAVAAVARKKIARMSEAQAAGQFVLSSALARAYLMAGNVENAFEWLEKAAAERNVFPLLFGCDPFYDPIREDPRFKSILQKVGVPRHEESPP